MQNQDHDRLALIISLFSLIALADKSFDTKHRLMRWRPPLSALQHRLGRCHFKRGARQQHQWYDILPIFPTFWLCWWHIYHWQDKSECYGNMYVAVITYVFSFIHPLIYYIFYKVSWLMWLNVLSTLLNVVVTDHKKSRSDYIWGWLGYCCI